MKIQRKSPAEKVGLNNEIPLILVLGGSQGGKLNDFIMENLRISEEYQILHQTGMQIMCYKRNMNSDKSGAMCENRYVFKAFLITTL